MAGPTLYIKYVGLYYTTSSMLVKTGSTYARQHWGFPKTEILLIHILVLKPSFSVETPTVLVVHCRKPPEHPRLPGDRPTVISGFTALHATAQHDQSEAALLLLSRGRAPTNARNASGTLDAGKQQPGALETNLCLGKSIAKFEPVVFAQI